MQVVSPRLFQDTRHHVYPVASVFECMPLSSTLPLVNNGARYHICCRIIHGVAGVDLQDRKRSPRIHGSLDKSQDNLTVQNICRHTKRLRPAEMNRRGTRLGGCFIGRVPGDISVNLSLASYHCDRFNVVIVTALPSLSGIHKCGNLHALSGNGHGGFPCFSDCCIA